MVCQPDRPQGRGKKLHAPPVKVWAEAHGLPVQQPRKLNDGAFEQWLRETGAEAGALAAYGRILKRPILEALPRGIINMHPSLLPAYRGPSPIQSAVRDGVGETGVTIMRLTEEMDAGDILSQERVPVGENETALELTAHLAELGGVRLAEGLTRMAEGQDTWTPQDHAAATYCRLWEKADGYLRWAEPAVHLHNLVRAAVPWPVAQCQFRDGQFRVLRARATDTPSGAAPGTVEAATDDGIDVATGTTRLRLLEVQPAGKRAMLVGDFLRGAKLEPGERFEELP